MSTSVLASALFRPHRPVLALTLGLALAGTAYSQPIPATHDQKPGEKPMTAPKAIVLKVNGVVSYSDFGAKGDGTSDDGAAIAAAHKYANEHGLPVKADDGMAFYIGSSKRTITIETDTDFGTAKILKDLGCPDIRLMTNNPLKVDALRALGINVVEQVPHVVSASRYNARYLATKRERMAHKL